jgi:beta-galactosidase/beta-glucuronidase
MIEPSFTEDFVTDNQIYAAHPRPDWARKGWIPLNGIWKLKHGRREVDVMVPFPIGSKASMVDFDGVGLFRYSRSFDLPQLDKTKRYLLHVGASDHTTTVFLNGQRVGLHTGGYASFSFEITAFLEPLGNCIDVDVRDSRRWAQVRGKQTFRRRPFYVWYTSTAGIWQPIWIEETGHEFLVQGRVKADFRNMAVDIEAEVSSALQAKDFCEGEDSNGQDMRLELDICSPQGEWRTFNTNYFQQERRFRVRMPFAAIDLQLWSPATPHLYALRYRLISGSNTIDTVESYFGLRKITWKARQIFINNVPIYLRMVLVQGYYPGGVYTPLSYSRIENDIRTIKAMGFNGARIHQKIESPYFHYLCDRLGLLTTYEMPSFYRPCARVFEEYTQELREVIKRDAMHPSCLMWVLFNETWGIWGSYSRRGRTRRFVRSMVNLVKSNDPTRPVIDNSGWEHIQTDIVDFHHYLRSAAIARNVYAKIRNRDTSQLSRFSILKVLSFYLLNRVGTATRTIFLDEEAAEQTAPWLLSEFGGFGWYKNMDRGSVIDTIERYTIDAVESGLFCGYCLTQLYDVERETNGLLTFERSPKISVERMKKINAILPSQGCLRP